MKSNKREEHIWDDRKKLYDSYLYTNEIYKKTLIKVSNKLNSIHHLNNSIKYWEILIGLWLKILIQTCYEKYLLIKKNPISLKYSFKKVIVPYDTRNFFDLNTSSSDYYESIYNQIFFYLNKTSNNNNYKKNNLRNFLFKEKHSTITHKIYVSLSLFLIRLFTTKILYYDLPLNKINKIKFIFIFKIYYYYLLSKINARFCHIIKDKSKLNKTRVDNLDKSDSEDEFENLINRIVLKNIPSLFLENYVFFKKKIVSLYPKKIHTFYVSNVIVDDIAKLYIAEISKQKTQILIHQHGGAYGAIKFYTIEDYELSICDKFLSWGWKNNKNSNVVPFYFALPISVNKIKHNPNGNLLITNVAEPEYSKYFASIPMSNQAIDEIDMHAKAISLLKEEIRTKVVLRIKYQSDHYKKFDNIISKIKIDKLSKNSSFINALSNARLYVASHNATSYLESFYYNIPTLILWKNEYREIRKSAEEIFKKLYDAEILFYSPENLAKKINLIFDKPYIWWMDQKIQNLRNEFCNTFARRTNNIFKDYHNLFNDK